MVFYKESGARILIFFHLVHTKARHFDSGRIDIDDFDSGRVTLMMSELSSSGSSKNVT